MPDPRPVVAGAASTAQGAELLGTDGVCRDRLDGRPTVDDLLVAARTAIRRCTCDEAAAAQQGGAVLVDTRSDADRDRDGVAPGSVHIPLSVLPWRADPASSHHDPRLVGRPLLVLCTDGYSSSLAVRWLVELGLDAVDVAGGFRAWLAAALPVEAAPRR